MTHNEVIANVFAILEQSGWMPYLQAAFLFSITVFVYRTFLDKN